MKTAAIAIALTAIFCACSTPSSVQPLSIPLTYKTQAQPAEITAVQPCATVSSIDVEDARAEKAIGKRFVEGKSGATADVTTTASITDWVRSGAAAMYQRGNVSMAASGRPSLHLRIDQIATNENVLHRAGYDGRVVISAELRGSGGNVCWKDRVEGASENYGYAGSVDNYNETLNHALDRAMNRIFSSPDYRSAACGCN